MWAIPVAAPAQASERTLTPHGLGWAEFHLPDSSSYFVHPARRIVTDVDLRNARHLADIVAFLDRADMADVALPPAEQGEWEIWLRNGAKSRKDFAPVRNWVDHKTRVLLTTPPPKIGETTYAEQDREWRAVRIDSFKSDKGQGSTWSTAIGLSWRRTPRMRTSRRMQSRRPPML